MHFTDIGRMEPPSPGGKRKEGKDLDKAGRSQDSDPSFGDPRKGLLSSAPTASCLIPHPNALSKHERRKVAGDG